MFTGIIEDIGQIVNLSQRGMSTEIALSHSLDLSQSRIGDSIAINGVCLTITKQEQDLTFFDIGPETLEVSNCANLSVGDRVHMERALALGGRLDGHLVQGHVDGIGQISALARTQDVLKIKVSAPENILDLCIKKGSISLNGVSLTINHLFEDGFEVLLIPHSLKNTLFSKLQIGDTLNIENDLFGKYVQRLLHRKQTEGPKKQQADITWDYLQKHGFHG